MSEEKKQLYVRRWLNEDEGRAHIIVDANHEKGAKYAYGTLELGDCARDIYLDFGFHSEETKQQRLKKLDELVADIVTLRLFLESVELPPPEKPKKKKSKKK